MLYRCCLVARMSQRTYSQSSPTEQRTIIYSENFPRDGPNIPASNGLLCIRKTLFVPEIYPWLGLHTCKGLERVRYSFTKYHDGIISKDGSNVAYHEWYLTSSSIVENESGYLPPGKLDEIRADNPYTSNSAREHFKFVAEIISLKRAGGEVQSNTKEQAVGKVGELPIVRKDYLAVALQEGTDPSLQGSPTKIPICNSHKIATNS
jgi:hypothetical protein